MNGARKFLIFIGDILAIILGFFGMLSLRFGFPVPSGVVHVHLAPMVLLGLIWLLILYIFNLYDVGYLRIHLGSLRNIIFALATSLIAGFLLFYLVSFPIAPKTNLIISVLFFGILLILFRRIIEYTFFRRFKQTIAFLGDTPLVHELIEEINTQSYLGYRVIGVFTSVKDIAKNLSDIVIINHTLSTSDLELLSNMSGNILNIREAYQSILNRLPVDLIDDNLALSMIEKTDSLSYNFFRRLIDIIISLIILIITLPFSILVSLLIKIQDGGPILIRQKRSGERGSVFVLYKFRSMIVLGEDGQAETGTPIWSTGKDDTRITPVGRVIRKLHIDEIPQMLNVLVGDITLVGPRPERPEFVALLEKEIPYYFLRHNIRPGFTGWAQIKFRYARSVMDSREKFEYDLYYINNRNFLLDLGIIAKTIQIILTH